MAQRDLAQALFSLLGLDRKMRRLRLNIATIATALACAAALQAGVTGVCTTAAIAAASTPTLNKQQIQEALAKAKVQTQSSGGSETGNGASFSKLTEGGGGEEESSSTSTTAKKTEESSTGLSSGVLIPLLIAGGGLLVGIAFLILRDARGVTPSGDLLAAATGNAEARAARLRKRRSKAKAARQQRKHNRR